MTNRLTPDDWIAAGFRALAEVGPQALKAEALARRLGTSKGSFYWHFKDVPAYHAAMLALWTNLAVGGIIEGLEEVPDPRNRLRKLAEIANDGAPDRFGGMLIEPAIRAWSLYDPQVAEGVDAVDRARMAYLVQLLTECELPTRHAALFYGAFIGLDDLQARGIGDTAGNLSDLVEMLLSS